MSDYWVTCLKWGLYVGYPLERSVWDIVWWGFTYYKANMSFLVQYRPLDIVVFIQRVGFLSENHICGTKQEALAVG